MSLFVFVFLLILFFWSSESCGLHDRLYLIYSSVVSFFIPLSVIILVSLKSILLLRKHLNAKKRALLNKKLSISESNFPNVSVTIGLSSLENASNENHDNGNKESSNIDFSHSKFLTVPSRKKDPVTYSPSLPCRPMPKSRSMSLSPGATKSMQQSLKRRFKITQHDTSNTSVSLKTVLESYWNVESSLEPAKHRLNSAPTITPLTVNVTSPKTRNHHLFSPKDRQNIKKSTTLMQPIDEETKQSPAIIKNKKFSIFSRLNQILFETSSITSTPDSVSFTSIYREDYGSGQECYHWTIPCDEISPSIEEMASDFSISDVPSPFGDIQPLDLRLVRSRTFHSSSTQADIKQEVAPTESKTKRPMLKRAYSINFPIGYLFVQPAPLATMEAIVLPQDNIVAEKAPEIRYSKGSLPDLKNETASPFGHGLKPISYMRDLGLTQRDFSSLTSMKTSRENIHNVELDSIEPITGMESSCRDLSIIKNDDETSTRSIERLSRVSNSHSSITRHGSALMKHAISVRTRVASEWSKKKFKKQFSLSKQREKEKQAERVLLAVLFTFVCLWLPFFSTNFLYGICPSCVYEVCLIFDKKN